MLQNPSKYHPNPLSHFLALHNSQAAHNASSHPTLPTASTGHHPFQQEHPHQHPPHHGTMTNHNNHHRQLKATHSHLMDANTSLDAGKSFTIAAILGLQKNAIENNRKDYNVINLSLNNNNNNNNSNNYNSNQHSTQNHHIIVKGEHFLTKHTAHNSTGTGNSNSNNISAGIQNFNCDTNATTLNGIGGGASSLASRYLPTANVNSSASFSVAAATHQQQSTNAAHLRVNSFAAAAAVAAAAAANMNGGAPTALQSLQQLHQHHAQQSNLNFQRDKIKMDNHTKKSSLKNKRVRTIFTPEQLERLEAEFERQQYMVGPERLYLAHTLQLTEAQVKVWFQNRRIKWRKHHLEITQQRLALLRQSQMSTTTDPPNPRTTTVTPSCDEPEDLNNTNSLREIGESSRQASESDLSICNDSNDADSYIDGDDT